MQRSMTMSVITRSSGTVSKDKKKEGLGSLRRMAGNAVRGAVNQLHRSESMQNIVKAAGMLTPSKKTNKKRKSEQLDPEDVSRLIDSEDKQSSASPDRKENCSPNVNVSTPSSTKKRRVRAIGKLVNMFSPTKHEASHQQFGKALVELMEDQSLTHTSTIPAIYEQLLSSIAAKGLLEEGTFRQSGSKAEIDRIAAELDDGTTVNFADVDVHCLTGLIKKLLRELPESLLSGMCGQRLLQLYKEGGQTCTNRDIQSALDMLPAVHFHVCKALFKVLVDIAASPATRLTPSALSTCFGTLLFNEKLLSATCIADIHSATSIVQRLIEDYANIFNGASVHDVSVIQAADTGRHPFIYMSADDCPGSKFIQNVIWKQEMSDAEYPALKQVPQRIAQHQHIDEAEAIEICRRASKIVSLKKGSKPEEMSIDEAHPHSLQNIKRLVIDSTGGMQTPAMLTPYGVLLIGYHGKGKQEVWQFYLATM
eukprot:TRINITY_DN1558_c6_g1_i1.p1 TRINITY_DN1558_c6_g1~~TRINITY_DN1558_c6_g1_i1.p1  ORF type:complete len:480 (-),score=42.50 TRINITY_DN1558_c6_g1_i1:277-1716(-)